MSAEKVISRLSTVFGEPKTENPEDYIDEFLRAMAGYDAQVLMDACDEVIRTATFFPRPGELLAIVSRKLAARAAREPRPYQREDEFEFVGPEDERYARALTRARVDAPAYARMIEKRGKIKVRKEQPGPMKGEVRSVITDISKRMTGEHNQ